LPASPARRRRCLRARGILDLAYSEKLEVVFGSTRTNNTTSGMVQTKLRLSTFGHACRRASQGEPTAVKQNLWIFIITDDPTLAL